MKKVPSSLENEQGVLGCILISPVDCLGECIEKLPDSTETFYDLRHQLIFSTLLKLHEEKKPIDIISLQQQMRDSGQLDQVGGIIYLNALQDSVPSAANLSYYLDIIIEKFVMRKILQTCNETITKVYSFSGSTAVLLDEFERDALSVRTKQTEKSDLKSLVDEALLKIEEKCDNPDKLSGFSTGLKDLDRLTDGIHGGEMIVVGGFPSTGKTALSVGIATHNALEGVPALILTAEMRPVQLIIRSICSEARANFKHLTHLNAASLIVSATRLAKTPLHVVPANGMTIGQVSAIARRHKSKYGIKIIVIDYIQLLHGTGDNREQEISSISKGIRSMALELNCAVIALSQLTDDGKLRESRAPGQDADSVWKISNDGEWQPKIQPINLNVEKCRDGETGSVGLIFKKEITRFENKSYCDF